LPLVTIAFFGGIYYLTTFFSGSAFGGKTKEELSEKTQQAKAPAGQVTVVTPKAPEPDDYIYKSLKGRDYSLTYLSKFGDVVMDFWVEIRDEKGETLETWQKADFDSFGYKYKVTTTGMIIATINKTELLFREKRLPNYVSTKKENNVDMSVTNPLN